MAYHIFPALVLRDKSTQLQVLNCHFFDAGPLSHNFQDILLTAFSLKLDQLFHLLNNHMILNPLDHSIKSRLSCVGNK